MRSRSVAADFMRLLRVSLCINGIATVSTVATVAIATRMLSRNCGSVSFSTSVSIICQPPLSYVEVDHLLHDENPYTHPKGAYPEDDLAGRRLPENLDVVRTREID